MIAAMRAHLSERVLVNWTADPVEVRPLVPPPFEVELVQGRALIGVCFVRLEEVRPVGLPAWAGVSTSSAAHRVAVQWEGADGMRRGVYILRRDTDSRTAAVVGGRLFPGVHERAVVRRHDAPPRSRWTLGRGGVSAAVAGVPRDEPSGSVFSTTATASRFFRTAPLGWSPGRHGRLDGVALEADSWRFGALEVEEASASFWEAKCPSAAFDSAFVMRRLPVTWRHVDTSPVVDAAARTSPMAGRR